jgi:hypothetical protein
MNAADKLTYRQICEANRARNVRRRQGTPAEAPTPPSVYEELQAECRTHGLILHRSITGRGKAEHWMFDAISGGRILNYWPSTKKGHFPGRPTFIVGDEQEAVRAARAELG